MSDFTPTTASEGTASPPNLVENYIRVHFNTPYSFLPYPTYFTDQWLTEAPYLDQNLLHIDPNLPQIDPNPPHIGPNPPLTRTSTRQQQRESQATSTNNNPLFSPFTLSKVTLYIQDNLQTVCTGWSEKELEVRRRLVKFQRFQKGSEITTSFRPVSIGKRTPKSYYVSCILSDDSKRCYITFVDTFQLLEFLIGVRFTREEKNRFSRNLEEYKPITISRKNEEDCYKLIIGFPDPKPVNIKKKSVKVFA
jgi:hypothetical protein